jgi:hypothetical protein
MKNIPRSSVSNVICGLVKSNHLIRNDRKGHYVVTGNAKPNGHDYSDDPETVVIDDLLNAMARAEPILRKWRNIQKVLREIA